MDIKTKPQLHASMLETMARCGVQFQFRYGGTFGIADENMIIPPNVALATGTSVHKSVQADLDHKMETGGQLLPAGEIKEIAFAIFQQHVDRGMTFSPDESVNLEKTVGSAMDMTVALSMLHHNGLAPTINPLAVEKKFVITMNGYPYDVAGQIDVVEAGRLRDTKTKAQSPGQDAAKSLQMALYSVAYRIETKKLPDEVCLDFLVKTKNPRIVIRRAVPEASWIDPVFRRLERATEIIEAVKDGKQAFSPADPENWCCSDKWCGYSAAGICPFRSGR